MPRNNFDKEVDRVLSQMSDLDPTSNEYHTVVKNLDILTKAQQSSTDRRFSKDAILAASANLAGIILILGYEKANVITTKAISFIPKTRLP